LTLDTLNLTLVLRLDVVFSKRAGQDRKVRKKSQKVIELYSALNGAQTKKGLWAPCCICGQVTLVREMKYVKHIFPERRTPWACRKCLEEEGLNKHLEKKSNRKGKLIMLDNVKEEG